MTWPELRALGMLSPRQRADAGEAFVRPFMQRVRRQLDRAHRLLRERGYQFLASPHVLVPPQAETVALVEERYGPLPLSLRYFWLEVGAVDFRQSARQLVQWPDPRRGAASPIETLGEEDPLYVVSAEDASHYLASGTDQRPWHGEGTACFLAADEFHKAHYSGGENYYFMLPDASADMPVHPLREWFADHLAMALQGGGFRGRLCDDGLKHLPDNAVAREVAARLGDL